MKLAVLGAGKGGHAAAGHAKLMGYEVRLWNRPGEKIECIKQNPELTLEGALGGRVRLDMVTDDLAEAVSGADVVSVMTTSNAYESIARNAAPYFSDGQFILLNCAGVGGSLLFMNSVMNSGYKPKITVGETDTCVYACKVPEPGKSLVKSIKNTMRFASLPPHKAKGFLSALEGIYPQFVDMKDPLAIGLWDATCLHTAGVVLNENRIGEDFLFYIEGITRDVAEYMELMDQERVAVAEALGLETETVCEWFNSAYGIEMGDLFTMIQKNPHYKHNSPAPKTFNHRYLTEEIPTKIAPQLEIAGILGIPQPITNWIVNRACELVGRDLIAEGRTLANLGLDAYDIRNYSSKGILPYIERNGLAE